MDKIRMKCPQCGGTLRFSLDDLARGETVRCTRRHNIGLRDNGHGARHSQQAFEGLERSIKRLNRKIG